MNAVLATAPRKHSNERACYAVAIPEISEVQRESSHSQDLLIFLNLKPIVAVGCRRVQAWEARVGVFFRRLLQNTPTLAIPDKSGVQSMVSPIFASEAVLA